LEKYVNENWNEWANENGKDINYLLDEERARHNGR